MSVLKATALELVQTLRSFMIHATPTQRCLFAILLNTPFIILFASLPSIGLFVDEWRELMNPQYVIAINILQAVSVLTQWFLAWKLWPHRFNPRPIPQYYRMVASLVCVSYAAEAFLGGNLTYPTCMVIICIIPIGLMLLDVPSVLFAFGIGLSLIILNEVFILFGWVDYAPGYSPQAFSGGVHHFMAELLRTSSVYLHFVCYAVIFWLLFDQYEYHRQLLKEMSQTDALTNLANRRFFLERLEQECKKQKAMGSPLCLALVDADHFKRINDSYGHSEGDRVLQAIAKTLRDNLRIESDVIGRVGGEEFAILMPGTAKADALFLCERIQEKLAEQIFGPQKTPFKVTLSMGLVEGSYVKAEALLHQADDLLYLAKNNGRNKIVSVEMMDRLEDGLDVVSSELYPAPQATTTSPTLV